MKTLGTRRANLFSLQPAWHDNPYVMKVRNETRCSRKEREREGNDDVHATFAPLILGRYVPARFQFRAKVEMISLGEKGVYDAWRLKEETW